MTEDYGKYSESVKIAIQKIFLAKTEEERKQILRISSAFHVPCIIVLYMCGEVSGWPDYLEEMARQKFVWYKYTEIKNVPAGCPWDFT